MYRANPILTEEDLKLFKKKFPTDPGWYYLAIYHPEAKWYYQYHILLDDQTGEEPKWYIGDDEMTIKELKAKERKHRMFLVGPRIPGVAELP